MSHCFEPVSGIDKRRESNCPIIKKGPESTFAFMSTDSMMLEGRPPELFRILLSQRRARVYLQIIECDFEQILDIPNADRFGLRDVTRVEATHQRPVLRRQRFWAPKQDFS